MDKKLLEGGRQSYMEPYEIYFWTATISSWQQLLVEDIYKEIIINSLNYLTDINLIEVFAFIIMPNHVHFIWRIKGLNGKETAQGSFLKFTAHEFKKVLRKINPDKLTSYATDACNKSFEFWQRDPLAIRLYTRVVAYQKLDYLHNNPLRAYWRLVNDPCDYLYSSASFYEKGVKDFSFLRDLRDEFE